MLSDVKKQYTILRRKKTALKTELCLDFSKISTI